MMLLWRTVLRPVAAAALAVVLAWGVGGQARLGRIDPALALPLLPLALLPLAWLLRRDPAAGRRRAAAIFVGALFVSQLALAWALARQAAWAQAALTAAAAAAGLLLADALVQWRRPGSALRAVLALSFLVAGFAGGHALLARLYQVPSPAPAPSSPVVMMTALPLRWSPDGGMTEWIARGAPDDPALARIAAAGPTRLVDSLADSPARPGERLLLAHPPALAPRELVAIDAFVRGGGRAVILADALSDWPAPHAVGDPRNPPVTSLLTPMLDHWGVTLAGVPADARLPLAVDEAGYRLRLFSAGRFDRWPATCRAVAAAHILHCRIGAGDVWLVGDADLLFAPLWRAAPGWAAHLRRADTMEWLDARLRGGDARGWLRPIWVPAATD